MIIFDKKETGREVHKTNNTKAELLYDPKIRSPQSLGDAIQVLRKTARMKVGFANGRFKVLTPSHLVFLTMCKSLCDILIVAVDSDYRLREDGESSLFTDKERAFAMGALHVSDYVTIFDDLYSCIATVNPDVIFKGADYLKKDVICNGKDVVIVDVPFEYHISDFLEYENKNKKKYFNIG